jgi:hypothetical protein
LGCCIICACYDSLVTKFSFPMRENFGGPRAIDATIAAEAATSTIPIVFAINSDPVAFGFVASLNRPGGNLTGVSYLSSELGAKRLGLMHELMPKVTDFAVLAHPTYPASALFISDVEAAARSLGLRIEVFNASTESEIDTAFAALSAHRPGALLMANNPLFTTRRERLIALAVRYAVPKMYVQREFANAGGPMALFGHGRYGRRRRLSGAKRKSDFRTVTSVFGPRADIRSAIRDNLFLLRSGRWPVFTPCFTPWGLVPNISRIWQNERVRGVAFLPTTRGYHAANTPTDTNMRPLPSDRDAVH